MTRVLRVGTRRSALALAQARGVSDSMRRLLGCPIELIEVTSQGDTDPRDLSQIGGTGVFVTTLRSALRDGRIDLAVHSLKDLPVAGSDDLRIGAVPSREDPRDVLVATVATLADLPHGARVGTGSPRRSAQLLAVRSDLDIVAIRGNVDTRLGLVERGEVDAVVLAYAGLSRLGRLSAISEVLAPDVVMPAPGQGALAVEWAPDRLGADDAGFASDIAVALGALDDEVARGEVTAERTVLAVLEAGCSSPIGVLARATKSSSGTFELSVDAVVALADGSEVVRTSTTAALSEAADAGRRLASRLLEGLSVESMRERIP